MTHQLQLDEQTRPWVEKACAAVLELPQGSEVNSDILHTLVSEPPHTGQYGIAFAKLKRMGRLQYLGHKVSTRKARNGAAISTWRLI